MAKINLKRNDSTQDGMVVKSSQELKKFSNDLSNLATLLLQRKDDFENALKEAKSAGWTEDDINFNEIKKITESLTHDLKEVAEICYQHADSYMKQAEEVTNWNNVEKLEYKL